MTNTNIGCGPNVPWRFIMLKIALIVAATAVPAFGVGWTASTMAHPRLAEATAVISPTTISPYDMQLNVKPHDLPVQYMQGDFN
jgi:hypothetical protein